MRFVLALLALILTASDVMAYPSAERLKSFSPAVYEAAQVAEKTAADADATHVKNLADLQEAEKALRTAVEKETDLSKFSVPHSYYILASTRVMAGGIDLASANAAIAKAFWQNHTLIDPNEPAFFEWFKEATAHQDSYQLVRGDEELLKKARAKMLALRATK